MDRAFKYAYIDTATTTQVLTGAGRIKRIIISETAAGTITIVDNTSGSTPVVALFKASIVEGYYDLDVAVASGIRVITGAASKVTVVYSNN